MSDGTGKPPGPSRPRPAGEERRPKGGTPHSKPRSEPRPEPRLVAHNRGLIAKNMGKRFKKRPVVRGVSIALQRGEVVGLLGPNGAGKTTCFYIITGLMPADYGNIYLDGEDITDLPMYRRARLGIGYLPQEASIFRGLSVENNIRAVLEVVEPSRDRREAILEALLADDLAQVARNPQLFRKENQSRIR